MSLKQVMLMSILLWDIKCFCLVAQGLSWHGFEPKRRCSIPCFMPRNGALYMTDRVLHICFPVGPKLIFILASLLWWGRCLVLVA